MIHASTLKGCVVSFVGSDGYFGIVPVCATSAHDSTRGLPTKSG